MLLYNHYIFCRGPNHPDLQKKKIVGLGETVTKTETFIFNEDEIIELYKNLSLKSKVKPSLSETPSASGSYLHLDERNVWHMIYISQQKRWHKFYVNY